MALAADVRIAAESARMNAAFIRLGLSACDAARAERIGLVSRVVPDDRLKEAVRALAADMLRNSPLGLRLTKECLKLALDAGSLEEVVAMEDRNQALAAR